MKAEQHQAYKIEQHRVTKMSEQAKRLINVGESPETWRSIVASNDPASRYIAVQSRKDGHKLLDGDAVSNPVRARIDIRSADIKKVETFYVGIKDIELPEENVRVLDWRAPIASVFYESDCGPTSYLGPDDLELEIDLLLRRALQIQNADLREIMDLDVLAGYNPDGFEVLGTLTADEYLANILNSPAGNSLREIIGTIQREQHQIIREPRDRPLVLQAVAGSGKSTIALHRLAQVLYDLRRRNAKPGKVTVFGPNAILVKYISRLLPSLQEEEVLHQTFGDWALSVLFPRRKKGRSELGAKPTVLAREQLDERRSEASVTKGTFEFVEALERLLARTAEAKLPRQDVKIGSSIICPKDMVWQWYREAAEYPYEQRLRVTADKLESWARNEATKLAASLEATANQYLQEVTKSFPIGPKERKYRQDAQRLVSQTRGDLMQAVTEAVKLTTAKWQMGNLRDLYFGLITQPQQVADLLPWSGTRVQQFCKANVGARSQRWDDGDLGAMLYVYTRVTGVAPESRWAHVVVDEGQDWSPLCYSVIRHWVQDESVTIVGDLAQGISGGAGLSSWEELRGRVFGQSSLQVREIKRSYRLNRSTLKLGLSVLEKGGLAVTPGQEAIRTGSDPELLRCDDKRAEEEVVVAFARRHLGKQWSVAVITPDPQTAIAWQSVLKRANLPVSYIGKGDVLEGRVTVTPVLLSKGLEFDYVAVVGAGSRTYPVGREAAKRLYVGITRTKQKVLITAQGKLSPLLPGGEAEDLTEAKTVQRKTPKTKAVTTKDEKLDADATKSRRSKKQKAEPNKGTETALDRTQKLLDDVLEAVKSVGASTQISLVEYLRSVGATVVDQRENGGALWLVGGAEQRDLVRELERKGWHFKFVARGGRATDYRDGWYTKQKG